MAKAKQDEGGWEPGVVHLRHKTGLKGTIIAHNVWHRTKFLQSQFAACEDVNRRAKKDDEPVSVEVVSEAEYNRERFNHGKR